MQTLPTEKYLNTGISEYRIYTKDDLEVDGEPVWGYTDTAKHEIVISSNISEDQYRQTLLHEIMHVALETIGLSDGIMPSRMSNEFLVHSISNQMWLLRSLNVELFEDIFYDSPTVGQVSDIPLTTPKQQY